MLPAANFVASTLFLIVVVLTLALWLVWSNQRLASGPTIWRPIVTFLLILGALQLVGLVFSAVGARP